MQLKHSLAPSGESIYSQKSKIMKPLTSVEVDGRIDAVAVWDGLLMVATSTLEGNVWDGCLTAVDITSGKAVASLPGTCGSADICWGGHGTRVICADDSGDVRVCTWKADSPKDIVEVMVLGEHDDMTTAVDATDGESGLVISGSSDRSIKIWDALNGREDSLDTYSAGHTSKVSDVQWKPDNGQTHIFASSSIDHTVKIWDRRITNGVCTSFKRLGMPVLSLAWEPVEQHLVGLGLEDGSTAVLDIRNLAEPLKKQYVHAGRTNEVLFCPTSTCANGSSSLLASVGDDGFVVVERIDSTGVFTR
ncbi:unnamed protein product [Choristocarpus tenellus]